MCRKAECLRKARKIRALERQLDCRIDEAVFDRLEAELTALEASAPANGQVKPDGQ